MGRTSTYADHDQPERDRPRTMQVDYADVAWTATLVQPEVARSDSQQPIVTAVAGPVTLNNPPVEIGVEARDGSKWWQQASWEITAANAGQATAGLGVDALRLPAGRYRVLVRLSVGGYRPVLHAGRLLIN